VARKKWLRIHQRKRWHELQGRRSRARGLDAERIAVEATKELLRSRFFDAYAHARHNDELDASHIDIAMANLQEHKLFVLQIKTKVKKSPLHVGHETPAERHRRKYPHIPLIEVRVDKHWKTQVRTVKRSIMRLCRAAPSAERVLDAKTLGIIAEQFRQRGYRGPYFWEDNK